MTTSTQTSAPAPASGIAGELDTPYLRAACPRGCSSDRIIGSFLTGWPSIIAIVLNYVKRSDVRGTWLDSHFSWQIRNLWFGALWVVLCLCFIIVARPRPASSSPGCRWRSSSLMAGLPHRARGWMALTAGKSMHS